MTQVKLEDLRQDIRSYLGAHLAPATGYEPIRVSEQSDQTLARIITSITTAGRLQEYADHVNALSEICGPHAQHKQVDHKQFNAAIRYLIERLQL